MRRLWRWSKRGEEESWGEPSGNFGRLGNPEVECCKGLGSPLGGWSVLRLLVEPEQGGRDRGEAVRTEEVGSCCSEEAVQIQTWENYLGEGAEAEEVGSWCSWEAAGAEGGQRKAVMATQVPPQPVQLIRTTRKVCVTPQMTHSQS